MDGDESVLHGAVELYVRLIIMKTLAIILSLVCCACSDEKLSEAKNTDHAPAISRDDYLAVGSVHFIAEEGHLAGHPIIKILEQGGVDCFLGDGSLGIFDLWCSPSDVVLAKSILRSLPKSKSRLINSVSNSDMQNFGDWSGNSEKFTEQGASSDR